jgi:amidophosphoribosyltransferase
MRKFIEADSLAFITMDGLYRAVGEAKRNGLAPQFCDACFSGEYPISPAEPDAEIARRQLSLLVEAV